MASELFHFILYCRDSGRTTYQEHFAKLRSANSCILQRIGYRRCCSLHKICGQLVKFGTGQIHIKVLWSLSRCGNKRKIDVGGSSRRKFFFRLFCCLFQTLHRHLITREIDSFCILKLIYHIIAELIIKIITTETVVSGCR